MKLFISTLGVFNIKHEDISFLEGSSRSYKLFKLLQYFITFRNKKILADTIIDNVWPNHESFDPSNMLRAQIYRLRQLIKSIIPEGEDESLYMTINFSNGYYSLDIGERVSIDIEEFERLISMGDSNINRDINLAIDSYEKALDIYKGSYLEENAYELWLVPMKNYYNKLYIKTVYKLLEILKERNIHEKIIKICQNAIAYEPNEEKIHIYLMEAFLKIGQIKDAKIHYEYMTFLSSEEILEKSSALKDINRKIQMNLIERDKTDIRNIKMKLNGDDASEALLCDFDYFRFLFNIQKKKRNIEKEKNFLTLITLNDDLNPDELKLWKDAISKVLKKTLRWGDVFTFWNDFQILIILQEVKDDGIVKIEKRIQDNIEAEFKNIEYNVAIKSTLIMPETSLG